MGVHPTTGIPLLPPASMVAPTGSGARLVPNESLVPVSLMGTPLCCNKLARDPGVKTLPKGHPYSDLSLQGGEGDAGGHGCPKNGHQVQGKYRAAGQRMPV